ncbi:MAG: NuoF family protein [Candidatus Aquicultorales bacterium]
MTLEELAEIREAQRTLRRNFKHKINVCMASGCLSLRSDLVKEALEKEVKDRGLEDEILISRVGCVGPCSKGPTVVRNGQVHEGMSPEKAAALVESAGKPREAEGEGEGLRPFFEGQRKIVLEHSGVIDPESIEDYIAVGGYETLLTLLMDRTPAEVVDEISRSGLRGRGGAGYPTGLKWNTVAKAGHAGEKYIVCNADEGDPGAYMDRNIMESNPHGVIEGLVIAGYAVGAGQGFVYIRAEYPLAIERIKTAVRQAQRKGLLGQNIAGTGFSFHLEIRYGAGAFVTGEETALLSSVQGMRGLPQPRPPYPAESGLWGRPTLINNVETVANVAPILKNGGDWYASIGTEKSKGTKVFALAGKINNTGLIEVPLGIPLRDIIFELGGGIPSGRAFKAVQTGGPSGGCIPEEHLDLPVEFESLASVGSIMGSGGMIVMDDTSCMVDVAKYFMSFCKAESCGKCIPCRVGTTQMHGILERITNGAADMRELKVLEELCELARNTSLCGLGQSAPNPVLSTLQYFRDEYLAHIEEKRCPAGVCSFTSVGEEELEEVRRESRAAG